MTLLKTLKEKQQTIRNSFYRLIREDFEKNLDNTPLLEMGIDSLDFFEQMVYLEDELGFRFSVEDISHNVTINDLLKMLEN